LFLRMVFLIRGNMSVDFWDLLRSDKNGEVEIISDGKNMNIDLINSRKLWL
jgi:hypothetical protein